MNGQPSRLRRALCRLLGGCTVGETLWRGANRVTWICRRCGEQHALVRY